MMMVPKPIKNPILHKTLHELLPLVKALFSQKKFPYRLWREIEEKTEYQRCIELMKEDPAIARYIGNLVGTSSSAVRCDAGMCIRRLFDRVYEVHQDDHSDRFEEAYREFEDFFCTDDLEFELVCPLVDFTLEGESLDLGNSLRLIALPADIRADLSELSVGVMLSRDALRVIGTELCLHSIIVEKKVIGDVRRTGDRPERRNIVEGMHRLLQCMRLFQAGDVGSPFILTRSKGWVPVPTGFALSPGSLALRHRSSAYTVTASKRQEFADFCSWCCEALATASGDIDVANRRFNYSYEREREEDGLIDLAIALESLFLEDSGEFRYKLGMRVAALLGRTGQERQRIFHFVSSAYKTRSDVVHGRRVPSHIDVPGEGAVEFRRFVAQLEEYVRQSVRKALEMPGGREERIRELERRILSGPEAG